MVSEGKEERKRKKKKPVSKLQDYVQNSLVGCNHILCTPSLTTHLLLPFVVVGGGSDVRCW